MIKYAASPAMRIVWMDTALKISSSLDMEMPIRELEQSQAETALFLGKVGVGISAENLEAGSFEQYDGVFLILDDEDRFDGKTVLLPETQCVSVRQPHGGSGAVPAAHGAYPRARYEAVRVLARDNDDRLRHHERQREVRHRDKHTGH